MRHSIHFCLALFSITGAANLHAQSVSDQTCKAAIRKADSLVISSGYWAAHPYYLEAAKCKSQRDYALLQMKSNADQLAQGVSNLSKVRSEIIAGDYASVKGDTANARTHYRAALQLWPDDSTALSRAKIFGTSAPAAADDNESYSIAMVNAKKAIQEKNYTAAVAAYESALAAKPGDETATRMLADCREMQRASQFHPSQNISYNESPADTSVQMNIPNSFSSSTSAYWLITYKGPHIDSYELTVFSRWGTKIFTGHEPTFKWDGRTDKDERVPEGTYFYILAITPKGAASKTYSGFVSVTQ